MKTVPYVYVICNSRVQSRLIPDVDWFVQVVFPILYKKVPEGLPQHLHNKSPGVDTAVIHTAQE